MFHSGQWERIFCLVQTIHFSPSSGNVFFNESFIPSIGKGFPHQYKQSTLLESSFLLAENVTDMSGNHILKTGLIFAGGNSFSLPLAEIFFKQFFIPAWKYIFQSRGKSIIFYLDLFPCQWKPLFRLWASLFKALITAIDNDFLCFFSDISTNVSSFPASGNRFSGQWKPFFLPFSDTSVTDSVTFSL